MYTFMYVYEKMWKKPSPEMKKTGVDGKTIDSLDARARLQITQEQIREARWNFEGPRTNPSCVFIAPRYIYKTVTDDLESEAPLRATPTIINRL